MCFRTSELECSSGHSIRVSKLGLIAFFFIVALLIASFSSDFSWVNLLKRLLFNFTLMGLLSIVFFEQSDSQKKNSSDKIKKALQGSLKSKIAAVTLCLILANSIIYLRYIPSFNPKGFDTAYYIYTLRSIYLGKYGPDSFYHPIATILLLPLAFLFEGDPFSIGVYAPFLICSTFVILLLTSFYLLRKSPSYTSFVTIFSVANFFFIRMSYDLFAQTLFMGILMFAMSNLATIWCNKNYSAKTFLYFTISLVAMLLIDFTLSVIAYIFFLIITLTIKPIRNKVIRPKITRKILLAAILAMSTLSLVVMASELGIKFMTIYNVIISEELSPFHLNPRWDWIICKETLPLLLFSAISVAYLVTQKVNQVEQKMIKLLALWSGYVLTLIIISGYEQSYRLILLFPISSITGMGIYHILEKLHHLLQEGSLKMKKGNLNYILMPGVVGIIILAVLPIAYIPQYEYFPTPQMQTALSEISSIYGFNSPDVLFLVSKQPNVSPHWYKAYLGRNIFVGSIEQFLESNTTARIIVVHRELYDVRGLVRLISDKVNRNLYLVNLSYLHMPVVDLYDRWTKQVNVTFQENSFNKSYFKKFGDIDIVFNDTFLSIKFFDNKTTGKIIGGIRRPLNMEIQASEVFLVYNGDVNGQIRIEFYYNNRFVGSIISSSLLQNSSGDRFCLATLDQITFDEYRIVIMSNNSHKQKEINISLISFGCDV